MIPSTTYALVTAALVFGLAGTPTRGDASPLSASNFNGRWRLLVGDAKDAHAPAFDDSTWKPVTLPRGFNEDEAFRKDITELSTGISWYRKRFRLPAGTPKDVKVFLEFQGVRHAAKVWVNGKEVGLSENGVMAFGVDISDA